MAILNGREIATDERYSQVYLATHKGEDRLPFMYRSFISFTYGGKFIEDFNLIATITGNKLNKNGYSSFEDTVSTYDNLDGQFYWATHYKTNQIDFILSTDGIDQKQLDNFLYWFKAGINRELVLSEHPNRGIMARVLQPPKLNLLPFEQDVPITISEVTYYTKTTLYKGDIELSLVMAQPHWYSLVNILGMKDGDHYVDFYQDIDSDEPVSIFASKDALKILYEDGIPLGSMIKDSMLLGNNAYAQADTALESKIWDPERDGDPHPLGSARINGTISAEEAENSEYPAGTYIGIIAGAIVSIGDEGIDTIPCYNGSPITAGYFYYSGTAPAPVCLSFTLYPRLHDDYISIPGNKYKSENQYAYNTITIESIHSQTLRFTTPNVFTSYNKAIDIFKNKIDGITTWEDVRNAIRDQVRHARVREWAMRCLDYEIAQINDSTAITTNSAYLTSIIHNMSQFLKNANGELYSTKFIFNSETGEATGIFTYRTVSNDPINDFSTYGIPQNIGTQIEDVGDMLLSNYLVIQDRNYPTKQGYIKMWDDATDESKQYSHRITHTVGYGLGGNDGYPGLANVQLLYKNMYL